MFNKGCIPWNKNKKCPTISEAAKKRPMLVAGWNKDLPKEQQPRYGKKGSWAGKYGKDSLHWKGGQHTDKDGYILEFCPNHPFAQKAGYVRQNRLIYERHHNIILTPDIDVHHKNGIKDDNRIENLQAMPKSEHARMHCFEMWAKREPKDSKE